MSRFNAPLGSLVAALALLLLLGVSMQAAPAEARDAELPEEGEFRDGTNGDSGFPWNPGPDGRNDDNDGGYDADPDWPSIDGSGRVRMIEEPEEPRKPQAETPWRRIIRWLIAQHQNRIFGF